MITGQAILAYVNKLGATEVGVCLCGHWYEEHDGGYCEGCHVGGTWPPTHRFEYDDAETADREHLWTLAEKLTGKDWEAIRAEIETT